MLKPHGIIPAMVTPLTKNESLNESALRKLVNHLVEGGVHGLFAVGSQGEFWAFSLEEKRRILEVVVDEAQGRVPVYAGTAAITTRQAIALTQMAEEVGADAVSVLTPFYVAPSQQELYDHYAAIAAATKLPVLLYSNPGRTGGLLFSPQIVADLARIDNIVGMKDSSGDLSLTAEYIDATPDDFAVLMGRDTLILGGLLYGCAGAIAATANVAPRLVADIYESFQAGDIQGARQAQERLAPLRRAFGWGTFPVVIKEALDLMGLGAGPARRPVGPISPETRERLSEVLKDLGVL